VRTYLTLFISAILLTACSTDGVQVSQILIGSEVNEREEIVVDREEFSRSDRTFHAHVFTEGHTEQMEIIGTWWYGDTSGRKVFETRAIVTPEFPVAKFILQSNEDWPVGTYTFVASDGERELEMKNITVSASE